MTNLPKLTEMLQDKISSVAETIDNISSKNGFDMVQAVKLAAEIALSTLIISAIIKEVDIIHRALFPEPKKQLLLPIGKPHLN